MDELQMLIQIVNKRPMFRTRQDLEFIDASLTHMSFFQDLKKQIGDEQYHQILKELVYECHQQYEPQVQVGDQSSKFYFILEGQFLILTRNILSSIKLNPDLYQYNYIRQQFVSKHYPNLQPQGYLFPGQYFGESVLMFDQSHTQTILPLEKCHLLVIKRDVYRRVIDIHARREEAEKFAFLSGVQMFVKWSAKTLRNLIPEIHEVTFIQNQFIYQQGDQVEAVYVILEGEVQLFKIYNKNPVPIAILGSKECFGDEDILNLTRTHSARTLGCVKLFRIMKPKFLEHIPFDYQTLDYKDYQRALNFSKLPARKPPNNGPMVPLKMRSESMMLTKSPSGRLQKFLSPSKTYNSTYHITDLLRKNKFKNVQQSGLKKAVHSQSPNSRLQAAFSPNSSNQEEVSNDAQSRIHGLKYDRTSYLMGQMKLRSITQSTWNKKQIK